jgi:hypothetical protein
VELAQGKNTWKINMPAFQGVKKETIINLMFYETSISDTGRIQQQVVVVVIKYIL